MWREQSRPASPPLSRPRAKEPPPPAPPGRSGVLGHFPANHTAPGPKPRLAPAPPCSRFDRRPAARSVPPAAEYPPRAHAAAALECESRRGDRAGPDEIAPPRLLLSTGDWSPPQAARRLAW